MFLFAVIASVACSGAQRVSSPSVSPARSSPGTVAPKQTPTPTPSPTAAVRYVAIGASDTVGVGATDPTTGSWPARVAALLPPGSAYVNLGVSG